MEQLYNVVLTGEMREGTNVDVAKQALATLIKVSEGQVNALLARAPVVIKANVTAATAQKYVSAVNKTGAEAMARVIEYKPEPVVVEASSESTQDQHSTLVSTDHAATAYDEGIATDGRGGNSSQVPNPPEPTSFKGYEFHFAGKPDYGFVTVTIPKGETLKVEASAMATMDTHLVMKTKLKGGLGRFLTGENLFVNEFTAEGGAAEIGIAPGAPGDISHVYLEDETIFLQNSAYVASTQGVELETKFQGLTKSFFSGENFFLVKASGQGDLWFNTYGAILEIDVSDGYVVDSGNIVAFTEGLEYTIDKVGGYKSLFFSGEGFVCKFSGQGKVWIQTRSVSAFAWWANWYRPVKNNN